MFGNENKPRSGEYLEKSIKKKVYYKHQVPIYKIPLINSFNKFLRDSGKIIIDMDQLALCDKYKIYFSKCYMTELFSNPTKFVSYQPGVNWSTESGEIYIFQLQNEKFFNTYYKMLTGKPTEQPCKYCDLQDFRQRTDIAVICMYCGCSICFECFVDRRDQYFRGNNFFRCLVCREINHWE